MPSRRLDGNPASVGRFDVIGRDADSAPNLVRHVGLSNEDRDAVKAGDAVRCAHMVPPLEDSEISVHLWGSAELTYDESRTIKTFLDVVKAEYERVRLVPCQQYIALPHMMEKKDEMKRTLYRKFSCAGLVVEAYLFSKIKVVETGGNDLPEVDKSVLESAFGILDERTMRIAGLDPSLGAWRVLLPGYVFYALARYKEGIRPGPYRAKRGDCVFP